MAMKSDKPELRDQMQMDLKKHYTEKQNQAMQQNRAEDMGSGSQSA